MKPYIITSMHRRNGFFGYLNNTLGRCLEAESRGMVPVVDWAEPKIEFYVEELGENPFDYYFDQPLTLEQARSMEHDTSPGEWMGYPPPGLLMDRYPEIIQNMHYAIQKYLRIKQPILDRIDQRVGNFKTLGVHCRLSDMARLHPEFLTCKSPEEFYEKTMKVFREGGYERLYLATEETAILDYFRERCSDILFYQEDCYRISTDENHMDVQDGRLHHRARMGSEVLTDCLNLSNCDGLLCGISSVTYGAMFFNGLKYSKVHYFYEIQ